MIELLKTLGFIADKDTDLVVINGVLRCETIPLTVVGHSPELAGLSFCTNLHKFAQAYKAAGHNVGIALTKAGKIKISSGAFKALLPNKKDKITAITDMPYTGHQPLPEILLEKLKEISAFIGDDFMRPWMNSVLIKDQKAYATTNPVMIETDIPNMPAMMLPGFLVKFLVKVKKIPVGYSLTDNGLFLRLENNLFVRSSLLENKWPLVDKMIPKRDAQKAYTAASGLKENLDRLLPLCPDKDFPKIYLDDKGMRTEALEIEASINNIVFKECVIHAHNLALVLTKATAIDLNAWPNAMHWVGDDCQGLLIGLSE